jgi:phage FluMu protein Com
MNLRCSYCQTMFAVNRETTLIALKHMEAEGLHHYDAHCPKCRRANSISHDRLAFPGWREALAEMKKEAAKEQPKAPAKGGTDKKPITAQTPPTPKAKKPVTGTQSK